MPNSALEIVYFLISAVVVTMVCKRFRMTSVLGYLFLGVFLGPHFYGLFSDMKIPNIMAEFGVVFLLFTIGLELPWSKLQELKRYVLKLGSLQVFLTSLLFGAMAYFFGFSLESAILIGAGISFSSTAVILQLLSDDKELTTRYGRICFSVLLFQDLMVIILITWITMLKDQNSSFWSLLGWSTLKVSVVFIVFTIFGRFLLRPFYRFIFSVRSSDLFFVVTLLIIFATSFATERLGLSLGLGAFFAGVLLAETEYRYQIEADIKSFRSLLLGLFFLTVGMGLDPTIVLKDPLFLFLIFFLAIVAKAAVLLLACMILKFNIKTTVRLSLTLAGGSEFIFVLLKQAEGAHLFSPELIQITCFNVILSMMITPVLSWLGKFVNKRIGREIGFALKAAAEESKDLKNHVIIVGFGAVGETVHNLLGHKLISHVIVDINSSRVALGRMKNYPIFYGDARKTDIFHAFRAEKAKAVVITPNDFAFSSRLVSNLKSYYPNLKIFVRVQDTEEAYKMHLLGAEPVTPEIFAPSFQLASNIFETFGLPQQEIDIILERYRSTLNHQQLILSASPSVKQT